MAKYVTSGNEISGDELLSFTIPQLQVIHNEGTHILQIPIATSNIEIASRRRRWHRVFNKSIVGYLSKIHVQTQPIVHKPGEFQKVPPVSLSSHPGCVPVIATLPNLPVEYPVFEVYTNGLVSCAENVRILL